MKQNMEILKKAYMKQGGKGEFKYWKPKDNGEYVIRILPPTDGAALFYEQTAQYSINEKFINAPFIVGDEDPIYDKYKELWKEGTAEAIEMARKLKPRKQYIMNIVVREEKGVAVEEPTKVYLFSAGEKLHDKIMHYFWDADYGDLTDVEEGFDFKIVKEDGSGGFANYDNSRPRNKCSPLFDNKEMIQEALDGRYIIRDEVSYKSAGELENILKNFIKNWKS